MGPRLSELPPEDQPGLETIETIVMTDAILDDERMHRGEITRHEKMGRHYANLGMLTLARDFEALTKSVQGLDD